MQPNLKGWGEDERVFQKMMTSTDLREASDCTSAGTPMRRVGWFWKTYVCYHNLSLRSLISASLAEVFAKVVEANGGRG